MDFFCINFDFSKHCIKIVSFLLNTEFLVPVNLCTREAALACLALVPALGPAFNEPFADTISFHLQAVLQGGYCCPSLEARRLRSERRGSWTEDAQLRRGSSRTGALSLASQPLLCQTQSSAPTRPCMVQSLPPVSKGPVQSPSGSFLIESPRSPEGSSSLSPVPQCLGLRFLSYSEWGSP